MKRKEYRTQKERENVSRMKKQKKNRINGKKIIAGVIAITMVVTMIFSVIQMAIM